MIVKVYEVPYKLSKDNGTTVIDINEDEKEFLRNEEVPEGENEITKLANRLAQENDKARTIAKHTLLPSEEESTGKLLLKILS